MTIGTVVNFNKLRGFGYIAPQGKTSKDDQVFVHWKDIVSESRWPTLQKGQEVRFTLQKDDKGKNKAANVTDTDGDSIDNEPERDLVRGGPFSGEVKFFDSKKGWGFITPSKTIAGHGKEDVHFMRSEIVTASEDDAPFLKDGEKVRFQVYEEDGKLNACKITLPGGKAIVNPRSEIQKNFPKKKSNRGQNNRGQKRKWQKNGGGDAFEALAKKFRGGEESGVKAEVGIAMPKNVVGAIIGKKGATVKRIIKESGARIDFGDDDFLIKNEVHQVIALSGDAAACAQAAQLIAEAHSRAAQSLDSRIVFLCPAEWCGMLIGKKGENIKKIMKTQGFLRVDIADEPITLPGVEAQVNPCVLFGGQAAVKSAIASTVKILALISQRKKGGMPGQQGQGGIGGDSDKQMQILLLKKLLAMTQSGQTKGLGGLSGFLKKMF